MRRILVTVRDMSTLSEPGREHTYSVTTDDKEILVLRLREMFETKVKAVLEEQDETMEVGRDGKEDQDA